MHPDWQQPALHPIYLRLLLVLLARRGVDAAPCLAQAQLLPSALSGESGLVAYAPTAALINAAVEHSHCPWLGLEFGAAAQIHSHGNVANATVASGTLDAALRTVVRFAALRIRALRFAMTRGPTHTTLQISAAYALGPAGTFISDAVLVIVDHLLRTLSINDFRTAHYALPQARPSWSDRYAQFLQAQLSFDATAIRMCFENRCLDQPCLTADASVHARATLDCAQDLEQSAHEPRLATRIQTLLSACQDRYPGAEDIAAQLHLSPRSLYRRLAAEDTSVRELLDEARRERSCWLLQHTDLSIERIAERSGYLDTSNFSRSFKRWLGVTPLVWRREHT